MGEQVHQLLERRRARLAQTGKTAGGVVAVALHLGLVAGLLFAQRERPPEPLQIVSVNIVPAQALGVRRPSPPPPQPKAPEPEPEPVVPEPEPEPEPAPPEPDPMPEPEPATPAPTPAPRPSNPEPASTAGESSTSSPPAEPEGSPRGSAFGTTPFGAEVSGIDADFKHDYYVNRMLSMIHRNWVRPATGQIRCTLKFTVQRDGEIVDLELVEESGHNGFDLAALRAVRNASPLLPLPASYRKDNLTVTLIVR